ncbi:monocarboxylate transporter 7 isoform X2 [Clupea harengus]|nr:monocarboxylate transporter 7 isoform X2 [Clupea harengus]
MVGGLLISVGMVTTAFTTSVNQMYITTGIIAGLGYCLTFLPTVTLLSQYFCKHRSVVTSMASTGESVAIFTFAPAFTALKTKIGWRYTMVVIGLLQGTIVMCGALLRPIIIKPSPSDKSSKEQLKSKQEDAKQNLDQEQLHGSVSSGDSGVQSVEDPEVGGQIMEKEEKKALSPKPNDKPGRPKLLDLSVLKEGSFLCYSAFGLFATLGFFAPQLYVVELNVSQGVDRDKAAYSLSIMAIAEILGRLSIGWMMSWRRLRKIYVLLTCVLLLCLVLVLFTLVSGFWPVAVCCMLYGFLLGNVASTHIPMLAEDDVVGIQRMASAAGVYVCIQSFAGLAGPPLGGVLVDITGNYGSAFYSCAAGMALGALFLGLVRPAKMGKLCWRKTGQQQQQKSAVEKDTSVRESSPEDFVEEDLSLNTRPNDC